MQAFLEDFNGDFQVKDEKTTKYLGSLALGGFDSITGDFVHGLELAHSFAGEVPTQNGIGQFNLQTTTHITLGQI